MGGGRVGAGVVMLVMVAAGQADRAVVKIVGRFDAVEAPRVSRVSRILTDLGRGHPADRNELDLSGVTFFDSHALHAVLGDGQDLPCELPRFPVVAASEPVNVVYRLTGHGRAVGEAA